MKVYDLYGTQLKTVQPKKINFNCGGRHWLLDFHGKELLYRFVSVQRNLISIGWQLLEEDVGAGFGELMVLLLDRRLPSISLAALSSSSGSS